MTSDKVKIEPSWQHLLNEEFDKLYFDNLTSFIKSELASGKEIYPKGGDIFKAFELTPVKNLKVVILGQDPYHNPGEAMGLCFSVPKNMKVPPSLKNIYKELHTDVEGFIIPSHGDLTEWATQGVLLLNAFLTVEKNKPLSHKNSGWETFTDAVITQISNELTGIVFLLWGNFAKGKATLIDQTKHLVLTAAHPSPLAGGAFFGSKHFSQTNDYLSSSGKSTINWNVEST
jgi:uracil-DNA glycosylase